MAFVMDKLYLLIGKLFLLFAVLFWLWFAHPNFLGFNNFAGNLILFIFGTAFSILYLLEDLVIDLLKKLKKK